MNPKQYEAFLQRKNESDRAHSCLYGHYDCSDRDNGPCSDEEYPVEYSRDDEEVAGEQAAFNAVE